MPSIEQIRCRQVLSRPSPDDSDALGLETRGWTMEESLVVEHLRGVEHRGSDVRLDSGQLMSPKVWPRRALRLGLWKWRVVMKWPWSWGSHINILETRATLSCSAGGFVKEASGLQISSLTRQSSSLCSSQQAQVFVKETQLCRSPHWCP